MAKILRAILIDPIERRVIETQWTGDWQDIAALTGAEKFTLGILKGHVLVLGEDAARRPDQQFFALDGDDQPFAGKAVILGIDGAEEIAASFTISDVEATLHWLSPAEAQAMVAPAQSNALLLLG